MRLVCAGLLAAVSSPLFAQGIIPVLPTGKSAQGDVAVTIYNEDRALVQDRRELTLSTGRVRQEFPDVSARIRPETVTLTGNGIGIVEQNFDFDLLTPSALMQKAVGETVTLVRTNPATGAETRERALVLAANGGVVVKIGDRIEVLRDDGLPTRVVFDRVPDNLRARPTLSVTLEASRGGRQPVTLNYLTSGLGWSADYVALFDEPNKKMDIQGWITLTNNSGTTFENARTLLVAGNEPNQSRSYYRPPPPPPGGMVRAGTESANRERLGGFYLYPLPERTTIANRQTKQVSFLDVHNAAAARGYEYRNAWLGSTEEPQSVNSVLRFSSSRNAGLGDALPAGTVRVYQRDARGNPQFVGEHQIGHTPMGSDLSLATGEAFDVKVKPIVEERTRLGNPNNYRWRTRMRYTLSNAGPQPVTVDLVQSGLWGDVRITSESIKSERMTADDARWRVIVPANGETVVTATFDTRY
ncbi:DUF4139 domain-containing protein [Sphingomonas rhizophila]|uniref:DUF4139 domain-containing protein n=1 Tax=Sphingomonas rhizophila TaxID=2071607 RepID=A0A7G9SAT5_9SPHN|nr:DUF4139 domain-containing protein [Sphingomonas rhizophila]QNN64960.1 DUF4139 domain-containing protein [Sphingomonas rhizophila]